MVGCAVKNDGANPRFNGFAGVVTFPSLVDGDQNFLSDIMVMVRVGDFLGEICQTYLFNGQ